MAKFLIENFDQIDHRNLNVGVPISLAFRFMKEADLEFLANKEEIEDSRGDTLLHNAARREDAETARFPIEKGAKVDSKTSRGRTPLCGCQIKEVQ